MFLNPFVWDFVAHGCWVFFFLSFFCSNFSQRKTESHKYLFIYINFHELLKYCSEQPRPSTSYKIVNKKPPPHIPAVSSSDIIYTIVLSVRVFITSDGIFNLFSPLKLFFLRILVSFTNEKYLQE